MTQIQTTPSISFLGIGLMGKPMATNLLKAGFALTAWNRTQSKAEALRPFGARIATSIGQAASSHIIITMLEAGPQVVEVIDLILPSIVPGTLVIDMSSTQQIEAQLMHAKLADRSVHFIDAPVSGGVVGAEAATLAIMAGGSEEQFNRAQFIFSAMGRSSHVGPAGCGQLAKLCNQLIVGATLDIVAEALLLAQVGGANPVAVRNALRGGFAESRILEVHGQRMLDRNFIPGGQVKSQVKDMENILIAARNAGLTLPIAELVTEHYRELMTTTQTADQSAILLNLEKNNSGKRLGYLPDKLP